MSEATAASLANDQSKSGRLSIGEKRKRGDEGASASSGNAAETEAVSDQQPHSTKIRRVVTEQDSNTGSTSGADSPSRLSHARAKE